LIVSAIFSPCKTWRYELRRIWDQKLPLLVFVMLNPSRANAYLDDPTIRRCIGFARRLGYGGIVVYNIFALMATDPRELAKVADPIGPENDEYIRRAKHVGAKIVVAWGNNGVKHRRRVKQMRELLAGYALYSFGICKSGEPNHPLMLSYDTPLELWPPVVSLARKTETAHDADTGHVPPRRST
jgi:hypothetical protein